MKTRLPKKQKGAAAIEFALVFVIFFAVLYGVVSYSLPLLLVQSFNNATAEAVRRGMAVNPEPEKGYEAALIKEVERVLMSKLAWVPSALQENLKPDVKYDPIKKVLTVGVSLSAAKLKTIMPVLQLGVITVPDLPEKLMAESSIQIGN